MTEQQWTVIADRDKGDDPSIDDVQKGDRFTFEALDGTTDRLIRIERPMPVSERRQALRQMAQEGQRLQQVQDAGREMPTREQIAEVLYRHEWPVEVNPTPWNELDYASWQSEYLAAADAVLALIQNGADR